VNIHVELERSQVAGPKLRVDKRLDCCQEHLSDHLQLSFRDHSHVDRTITLRSFDSKTAAAFGIVKSFGIQRVAHTDPRPARACGMRHHQGST